MNALVALLSSLLLIALATFLQPHTKEAEGKPISDLSSPVQYPIRVTATVSVSTARTTGTYVTAFTPNNQELRIWIPLDAVQPERMIRNHTYRFTGSLTEPYQLMAKSVKQETPLGLPGERVTLALKQTPSYDKTIGRWRYFIAFYEGRPIDLLAQSEQLESVVVGQWGGDEHTFIVED